MGKNRFFPSGPHFGRRYVSQNKMKENSKLFCTICINSFECSKKGDYVNYSHHPGDKIDSIASKMMSLRNPSSSKVQSNNFREANYDYVNKETTTTGTVILALKVQNDEILLAADSSSTSGT